MAIDISGLTLMVSDIPVHPVEVSSNVKVAIPPETPTTFPLLETIATDSSLLDHSPPVFGDSVVVSPIQISTGPVSRIVGGGVVVTEVVAVFVHVLTPVTVTE